MTPNIFSAIAVNDDDFTITSREKFLKKAAKKLNEIERLKEKGSLTFEECEKLGQEAFWKACLYEDTDLDKPNMKEERKRKKEEEKKKKAELKKEEERRMYEEYKRKMEETERKRKEEEQTRKADEQKRKEEEQKRKAEAERERKRKNQEKKAKKNGKTLEEEYKNLLLLHHGNNDKTFRILSLKYHPDKNVGRETWANEMQKKLGEMREMYRD